MLPLVFVFGIWIIYLLINAEKKGIQSKLFRGFFFIFISLSFLTAAYKYADYNSSASVSFVLLILTAYIGTITLVILNIIRRIKKGYYREAKKAVNSTSLSLVAGVVGITIGRIFTGRVSNDVAIEILVFLLIILGFFFSVGIQNLLVYYYIKLLEKTDQTNLKLK